MSLPRCASALVPLLLSGCAWLAPDPEPVVVTPILDDYGLPACEVNGVEYVYPIERRRQLIVDLLELYDCPVTTEPL